jgi:AcrR family transcriptional regulator
VTPPRDRPLRADARRNRDRLIEVATHAFAAADAEVTLEQVAREAGVGIGTLYRHFPTREALVEAAYRHELAKLGDDAPRLLAELPPEAALRSWMDSFVTYMAAKQSMAGALRAVVDSGGNPFENSGDLMRAALGSLLAAGAAAGTIRSDVDREDVLAGLIGVTYATKSPEQSQRLLDLLMDGLRPRS